MKSLLLRPPPPPPPPRRITAVTAPAKHMDRASQGVCSMERQRVSLPVAALGSIGTPQ